MSKHWREQREGGGHFALWLICQIGIHGGRRFARLFLYPITGYFFLRRREARMASRAFLARVFGRAPTTSEVLRHVYWRSATILDRIFFLTRGLRDFALETVGVDQLSACLARGQGMLLVGSHFGSFEVLRAVASAHDVPLHIVLDTQQLPAQSALFAKMAPDLARHIIDGSGDPTSTVLALGEAIAQGHVVALLADRGRPDETMLTAPLLGSPAYFPCGPWMLAMTLNVPVFLSFGTYHGGNRYTLAFEHFSDPVSVPRRDRRAVLRAMLTVYAERLEHHVKAAPYNWFNFYDFWDQPAADDTPDGVTDGEAASGNG